MKMLERNTKIVNACHLKAPLLLLSYVGYTVYLIFNHA